MNPEDEISRQDVLQTAGQTSTSTSNSDRLENKTTRRHTLKSMGISASALSLGQNLLNLGKPTQMVELPKLKDGDEVVKWFKVPKKWNEQRKHASTVLGKTRTSLEAQPGVVGTQLVKSDQSYSGVNGLQIEVLIDGGKMPKPDIPPKVEGVHIKQSKAPDIHEAGCSDPSGDCVNYDTSKGVAGGEQLCWKQNGSVEWCGTATCMVTDSADNLFMLHCGHVFWEDCADAQNNGILYRKAARRDGTEIGKVVDYQVDGDWSIIDTSQGGNFFGYIDDNDDLPNVRGYVTKNTLDYWASIDNEPCLSKMGTTTGETRGRLYTTESSFTVEDCTDMEGHGVYTYADMGQGDSGGPTWHWYNGDAYMVCNTGYYLYEHQQYDPCGNKAGQDSGGIAAYRIADYGYFFGGSPNYTI